MTSQPQVGRPYEFRVEGHLDDHWSAWLGYLTITRHHDGTRRQNRNTGGPADGQLVGRIRVGLGAIAWHDLV